MVNPKFDRWSAALRHVRCQSLDYCPRFPEVAARWESWWQFKADRPLLIAPVAKSADTYRGKAYHLLGQPDQWLQTLEQQLESTHYVAETLPRIRIDIGPIAPAAFLGAPLTVSEAEQTTWQEPVIPDWEHAPSIRFDPENPWFVLVRQLLALVAEKARGRYLACLPDMSGAIDTLANMRGPDNLCLDLIDRREQVRVTAMKIMEEWEGMYQGVMDAALERGAGLIHWLGCWSDRAYAIPTCDFSALIGPAEFEDCCLPSIARQAEMTERMLFHLDGPQSARHWATLARLKFITAIQYSPGAGTPSALAKLDMLRGIQTAGKPVLVITPKSEVLDVARRLDPRGTAFWVDDLHTVDEAEDLAAALGSR